MYFSIAIEFGWGQRSERVQKHAVTAWSWKRLSDQVKNRDGSVCQYCGAYAPGGGADHVVPLSRGGTDALDNLVWACRECNSSKGDKTPKEWDAPEGPTATQIVKIEIKPFDDKPVISWDTNFRPIHLRRFAKAALDGQLTIVGGHDLSRKKFQQIRDEAMYHGLLAWKDPDSHNQGVKMTSKGKQVFERLFTELNDG